VPRIAVYAAEGRPSIPPERLLRALLVQAFYSVRPERQLMEQLNYNLLFRWFVGLSVDNPVWDPSTFSKNRDRVLNEVKRGRATAQYQRYIAPRVRREIAGGWRVYAARQGGIGFSVALKNRVLKNDFPDRAPKRSFASPALHARLICRDRIHDPFVVSLRVVGLFQQPVFLKAACWVRIPSHPPLERPEPSTPMRLTLAMDEQITTVGMAGRNFLTVSLLVSHSGGVGKAIQKRLGAMRENQKGVPFSDAVSIRPESSPSKGMGIEVPLVSPERSMVREHLRESSYIPFLIRGKILIADQSSAFGLAKNLTQIRKGM
jgi:hypothetical protein